MASAAYRAGVALVDQRLGQVFDYTHKGGVIEARIVLPEGVDWVEVGEASAREKLWNAAEASERYKTARVAREWRFALPAELSAEERAACAHVFAQEWANRHGVAVDVALHEPNGEGDERNWHAHLLCTTRRMRPDGSLGAKSEIELSDTKRRELGLACGAAEIVAARERWAEICNEALERAGSDARIDHRSNQARGIKLDATKHVGAKATARRRKGEAADRADADEATRLKNAEAIRREPEKVLAALVSRDAVFTRHDIARELNCHIDDPQEFQSLLARLEQSPALVRLAPEVCDATGRVVEQARYSTLDMVRAERGMADAAERMHSCRSHTVEARIVADAVQRAGTLTDEQRQAVEHILDGRQIAAVVGDAGTGKSFSMRVAHEGWEAAGYRVLGAAPTGKAADGLQEGSGIESRTLHSLEHAWKNADDPYRLTARTVLVIDEAGMVGSQQLARVIAAAEQAGAKVVLVGDDKQLQAVEAGAPFRAIVERIGAAEITEIRRQNEDWAKAASMALARGAMKDGLEPYQARGHVRMEATREDARRALVTDYLASREAGGSTIILAHSNADVQALNEAVRAQRREAGELGDGAAFATSKGPREFAAGDRLVFLKNDRDLAVKNGQLGIVELAEAGRLVVRLDNGEQREVRQATYESIDHGYAVTIHKSQGVTVDHAFVLASGGMDKQLAYVAMTRHRVAATLYAGMGDFGQQVGRLVEHGRANYQHDAETRDSYYVTLEAPNGKRTTLCGVDLERAVAESGTQVGDTLRLDHVGSQIVTLPDGVQVERKSWRVATGAELAYERLAERLGRSQPKLSTLDFDTAAFADRRGFDGLAVVRDLVQRGKQIVERLKGRLDAAERRRQVQAEAQERAQRVELDVHYMQRECAKAAGARWDAETKRWYAPGGADMATLSQWLPEGQARRAAARAEREAAAKEKARLVMLATQQLAAEAQEKQRAETEAKAARRAAEDAWLASRAAAREAQAAQVAPALKSPVPDPMAAFLERWRKPADVSSPSHDFDRPAERSNHSPSSTPGITPDQGYEP